MSQIQRVHREIEARIPDLLNPIRPVLPEWSAEDLEALARQMAELESSYNATKAACAQRRALGRTCQ